MIGFMRRPILASLHREDDVPALFDDDTGKATSWLRDSPELGRYRGVPAAEEMAS
jgi:hypothetical protein